MRILLTLAILATDLLINHLDRKEGGGWTGELDSKEPIDLGLNEPHPFYTKEADDETST